MSRWFAFLICHKLGYKQAWVAIIFTVFTPVYMFIMFTSLTEILFSLVLISAIYFFFNHRFFLAAIVISFIPFVRSEGMMYVLLFVPVLIWIRQYKALLLLATGFVVFALAGWPHYHDLFWFFTHMPYSDNGSQLYGSGSFWYYFARLPYMVNYPLLALMSLGLWLYVAEIPQGTSNSREIKFVTVYFLILPSFIGFILVQSFLWWQGMMGVLGSTRFMASVLPLGAILSTMSFEWVYGKLRAYKYVSVLVGAAMILVVAAVPFAYRTIPMKTGINFAVMENLASWLKTTRFKERKALYSDPMFPFYMDIDPFDTDRCYKVYDFGQKAPVGMMKPGELLIWDAQFSGYEGHLPFDSLTNNPHLKLLNVFTPAENFKIIGGADYKLAVFVKAPRDTTALVFKQFFGYEYGSKLILNSGVTISNDVNNKGEKAIQLDANHTFSPAAEGKLTTLPGYSTIKLRATATVMVPEAIDKGQLMLVLSIDDDAHKVYKYLVAKDLDVNYQPGQWFDLVLTDYIDKNKPASGNYKVYVWYTGKNKAYVSNLKLEYMPMGFE